MKHTSNVYVTHLNHHNSRVVLSVLKSLFQEDLKSLIAEKKVDVVNCTTGSPLPQYRNKVMFYLVANHEEMFGIKASGITSKLAMEKAPATVSVGVLKEWQSRRQNMGQCSEK